MLVGRMGGRKKSKRWRAGYEGWVSRVGLLGGWEAEGKAK